MWIVFSDMKRVGRSQFILQIPDSSVVLEWL